MQPIIGELHIRRIWIIYLNNSVIRQLSNGTGHLDVRIVLKLRSKWDNGLILCHNHPSGTLIPSD
jgi:DNA repair protein RadC